MEYLSFNAAVIAQQCIAEAIRQVERKIESCGALTHQDAKQSADAKEYFTRQLVEFKADIEALKRLAGELGNQAYHAGAKNRDPA